MHRRGAPVVAPPFRAAHAGLKPARYGGTTGSQSRGPHRAVDPASDSKLYRRRYDYEIHDADDTRKGTKRRQPGAMPDAKAVAAMMKYNESLQKAGVLLALDGLHPAIGRRARVSFSGGASPR
jgi:hypothetical protein